jgi:hypothetical protein
MLVVMNTQKLKRLVYVPNMVLQLRPIDNSLRPRWRALIGVQQVGCLTKRLPNILSPQLCKVDVEMVRPESKSTHHPLEKPVSTVLVLNQKKSKELGQTRRFRIGIPQNGVVMIDFSNYKP